MAFIFTTVLILNLLPQPSDAFRLSEDNNSVIYGDWEGEKERWEEIYLPHAKRAKLVSKNATMLDIAKMYKNEQEKNPYDDTIVHKIMKTTHHERNKMLIKWERDNGYIVAEIEENNEITPTVRRELLKEIEEEEQKEREKVNQLLWNTAKAIGSTAVLSVTFGVSIWLKRDITEAGKRAIYLTTLATTTISVCDVAKDWIKRSHMNRKDDEIKIPPLRNMPQIPANHVKVDLYSL
jgi:hypothetical protein